MSNFKRYKKLWDEWDARACMMFSLSLQIFLILFASKRKRKSTYSKVIRPFIWLAYLSADSFAIYVLGKLSRSLNDSSSKYRELIAFWAPFLLLHLGGPDTITAFALEDNELWLRHFLTWFVQLLVTGYAVVVGSIHNSTLSGSFPDNNLIVPVSLVLLVGIIRNIERTLALYRASINGFKKSIPSTPNLGINYAKLMEEFHVNKEAGFPTSLSIPEGFPSATSSGFEYETAEELEVAHVFFATFKPLIVDLLISFTKREQSRNYLLNSNLTAEKVFRMIDIELGLAYDILYTKAAVVYSRRHIILRVICFFCIIISFAGFFFFFQTEEIPRADVVITHVLFISAIVLDIIGFLKLFVSDWMFINQATIRSVLCAFAPKRSRLYISQYNFINTCLYHHKRFKRIEKIKQDWLTKQVLDLAPIKTILDFVHTSLYTEEVKFDEILMKFIFQELKKKSAKEASILKLKEQSAEASILELKNKSAEASILELKKKSVDASILELKKKSDEASILELKKKSDEASILELKKKSAEASILELEKKCAEASILEIAKNICSSRGSCALEDRKFNTVLFMRTVEVEFAESILLWHIATDLCYSSTDQNVAVIHRKVSKVISEYMLYLLVQQPSMISSMEGVRHIKYQDAWDQATSVIKAKNSKDKISARNGLHSLSSETLDKTELVLFDACSLFKLLDTAITDVDARWELISSVWAEMLIYAASQCRGSYHAQGLIRGGELLTYVWFLMAHLGLGQQFYVVSSQTKVVVVK